MSFRDSNENNNNNNKEEDHWRLCALQLATSSVVPMVLQAVVELKVLEIIKSKAGEKGVSAIEIASELKLSHDATLTTASSMLDRMLCLLSAHSILTCTVKTSANDVDNQMTNKTRLYGLTPVAKYFIPNSDGASFGPLLSYRQDKVVMDTWGELKPAVLEGGLPFRRLYGMQAFDYLGTDARFKGLFHEAMINHSTIFINEILNSYKGFDQLYKVVDVGGSLGGTLNLITSKYPHITGINFDLPYVIQHAPVYLRVEHVGGNMFESVPAGGDAIFMKSILHDWDDDHCLKLLKNCYKALSKEGKVIVVEPILPLVPDTNPAAKTVCQIDLMMMTMTPGGKERTQHEYLLLATTAGFAGIRIECYVSGFSVMEFYK